MQMVNGLAADFHRLRRLTTGARVLDYLEERFRSFGATRFLATGIPLPGRPLAPLILRADWGECRGDKANSPSIPQTDPILQTALRARGPFEWRALPDGVGPDSTLLALAGPAGKVGLLGIPVVAPPYQGCVLAAGPSLAVEADTTLALERLCAEAFARLFDLNFLSKDRPGDLSARERRVIELSAIGKTAREIAALLSISQRTVHAHLQNASDKLRANNKAHTVVEALRYGQIEI